MKKGPASFIRKVRGYIFTQKMLYNSNPIIVGLSGGADSVCLLSVLREIFPDIRMTAAYIDHGLRPGQTPGEIDFCRDIAIRLGADFVTAGLNLPQRCENGLSATARKERLKALTVIMNDLNASRIALGHNRDDSVETFLINMIRGAGLHGLCGIPPVRGAIIRPLLDLRRDEIIEYLREKGLPFITDTSNLKGIYLRNSIRMRLIPALKEINPSIIDTISGNIGLLKRDEEYLSDISISSFERLIMRIKDGCLTLDAHGLKRLDIAIASRVIRIALNKVVGYDSSVMGISLININDILELLTLNNAGDRVTLPGGLRVIKGYDTLVITRDSIVQRNMIRHCRLNIPGRTIVDEEGTVIDAKFLGLPAGTIDKDFAYIDSKIIDNGLSVRMRKPGDYFYPSGLTGKKKLQDFFVDIKIPRDKRDSIPIVVSGDDIVWVAGYRCDKRFIAGIDCPETLCLKIVRGGT